MSNHINFDAIESRQDALRDDFAAAKPFQEVNALWYRDKAGARARVEELTDG